MEINVEMGTSWTRHSNALVGTGVEEGVSWLAEHTRDGHK